MESIDAIEFARQWEAAWNRYDVEAILKHFHEDVVFTSPIAKQIGFATDGVVNGKDALRRYWTKGLALQPDIRFEVTAVYEGIDTLVLAFKNQKGIDRAEVLRFKDGLVIRGHGVSAVTDPDL
jgi:ketosteroid isomerase-like protein